MAVLTNEVKMYIVQSIACYDSPSIVAASVLEEFGLTIDRSHVQRYDPTKVAGQELSNKLKAIFESTRKAFLEESVHIPIASKMFRLRSLQRMHDYYVQKKNFVQAAAILEQVAKEVGDVYSNKLKLGGDKENPFTAFVQQLGSSSLPVIQDVEGETIENEPQQVALWTAKK